MPVKEHATKVAKVTAVFWAMKIISTTFGEVAGDAVTKSSLGNLIGTLVLAAVYIAVAAGQISAKRFHPLLYWSVIAAGTTVGTAIADYPHRVLGWLYWATSAGFLLLTLASLAVWRAATGSVAVSTVSSPRTEAFYWATILLSQTLGTALGDFAANTGLGDDGAAWLFAAALAVLAALLLAFVLFVPRRIQGPAQADATADARSRDARSKEDGPRPRTV